MRQFGISPLVLAGFGGASLAGLWVARLTLGLDPRLHADLGDSALLLLYLGGGFGLAGAAAGAVAAGLARLAGARRRTRAALTAALAATPLLYAALLPRSGVAGELLTGLLAGGSGRRLAVVIGALAAVSAAAGATLAQRAGRPTRPGPRTTRPLPDPPTPPGVRPAAPPAGAADTPPGRLDSGSVAGGPVTGDPVPGNRRPRPTRVRLLAAAWLLAVAAIAGLALLHRPAPPAPPVPDPRAAAPPPSTPPPPRVVLLCIDGADPAVVGPMAARGELPAFARLMREGVWGELATLQPTLSPVVWTTLATGKPPEEHGVRHFTHVRLPGMGRSVRVFPLHTGLNFHLFPLLDRLPGVPTVEIPYTSNLRRSEALWTIAGRTYPVGVWRWLVTWPAEPVPGFVVAGGMGWAQFAAGAHRDELSPRATQPPGLLDGRPSAHRRRVDPAELARFTAAGLDPGRRGPRRRAVFHALGDPTVRALPELIRDIGARFTAAGFYPVDPFHHLFTEPGDDPADPPPVVFEAYRLTDRRLGRLMAKLGRRTRLVVVSDHGFDFAAHHHTWAPPGVFFARGPGFPAGRRVEGLTVYDVAPLVLRLLALPLADDMPGARTAAYERALSRHFLTTHPPTRVRTYERGAPADERALESDQDEEMKDVLRSLGYIG